MTTTKEERLIHAFVDGELDLGGRLELEKRMRSDAVFAREVEALAALRKAIGDGATRHAAPPALRARLRAPVAPVNVAARRRRWFAWRQQLAAAGLAAAVAVATTVVWLRRSPDDRLLDEVVASHVRSTLGEHLVDVASSDHHTVKPWLSSKLDFSPPVDSLELPGSVFVGGRLDYLGDRPVAALVYRQGAHVVNSFVWPTEATDERPVFVERRGYRTAHWSQRGMAHWVVSDLNREEFGAVVEAIRRVDAGGVKP